MSKPKVTLKLTENKKTNKNCQTSCIQGEQRPIDFIFRGDKKREGAGVNTKLTIWRKYLKIIGRNKVYFAIPNLTVQARFQSADRWIYEKKNIHKIPKSKHHSYEDLGIDEARGEF